jgi:hypothetical protein
MQRLDIQNGMNIATVSSPYRMANARRATPSGCPLCISDGLIMQRPFSILMSGLHTVYMAGYKPIWIIITIATQFMGKPGVDWTGGACHITGILPLTAYFLILPGKPCK